MKNNFLDTGAIDSSGAIILFFSISLVFSSLVISWMLFNAYGVEVSGLEFPELEQNTLYNLKTNTSSEGITIEGSPWNVVSGVGRVSTGEDSYILFDNAGLPNVGAHLNTYHISNPSQTDYSIVLSHSPLRNIEVIAEQDGYHVMGGLLGFANELYFYPYEGANQLSQVVIKTQFDAGATDLIGDEPLLKFYLNNDLLFDVPNSVNAGMQMEPFIKSYWGGIGSKNNIGLTLSNFGTGDESGISDLSTLLESIQIWGATLIKLTLWNVPEEYLPWELNMIFIKSQVFALVVGLLMWARGV